MKQKHRKQPGNKIVFFRITKVKERKQPVMLKSDKQTSN